MSRSFKKPFVTISKRWDKFRESSFRRKVKQTLQGYDPDRDWEELNLSHKGLADWGTKLGFDIPPNENDEFYEEFQDEYVRLQRK